MKKPAPGGATEPAATANGARRAGATARVAARLRTGRPRPNVGTVAASGRAAEQHVVYLPLCVSLAQPGDRGDLARQPFQSSLVELPLGIGLLALLVGA